MKDMPMERLESSKSPEELRAEIAQRSKELIKLEGELGRRGEDVETGGNSLDDQAIEETMNDLNEGQRIANIASLRREISELDAQLKRTEKEAA